jgi:deoxyribose-phosphate aldolase
MMDIKELLTKVDHTCLLQTATWGDIQKICDEGMKYHTASVCIPPAYVKRAVDYVQGKVAVCTVIGFPNGYSAFVVKEFEAREAIVSGADEIDMVINIGDLKDGHYAAVEAEIKAIKNVCRGKILKVIIETCLLTREEKIKMCEIVTRAKADFIKTSTGFSTAGATFDDVKLFTAHLGPNIKIKAAGGISSLEDAFNFIGLGCSRLGTSRIVKLIQVGSGINAKE